MNENQIDRVRENADNKRQGHLSSVTEVHNIRSSSNCEPKPDQSIPSSKVFGTGDRQELYVKYLFTLIIGTPNMANDANYLEVSG
jgi:hypothetical protein